MTRILFSFAAFAATLAAPALAETAPRSIQFERDGVSYVAQVRDTGNVQLITGHEVASGRTFELRVVNGRVSGDYAGEPIAYTLEPAGTTLQTAAR